MTTVAIDASTVLAWARKESGWQGIEKVFRTPPRGARLALPGTALTETITILRSRPNNATKGLSHQAIATSVFGQGLDLELMAEADHVRAAELIEVSRANPGPNGETLSLSDASIIAVAERLGSSVLTGDEHWADLSEGGHLRVKAILFPR